MDNFIKSISSLAGQKRLYPAEQIISNALIDYESIFSKSNLTDTDIEHVELVLLKLLDVNNGILSLQCCSRIAECLLQLYNRSSPPRVWNLFSQFSDNQINENPSVAAILATGFVINSIGPNIKSQIPGFVSKLLSLPVSITTTYEQINMQNTTVNVTVNINYSIPSMISLTPCFKKYQKDMKSYVNKAFDYAKRAIKNASSSNYLSFISNNSNSNNNNTGYFGNSNINNGFCSGIESHQLFALKLIRLLVKYREIPIKSILSFASNIFENAKSSFVIDETCYLIAKTALFYKINDKDDVDENIEYNEYYNRNQNSNLNDSSSGNASEEQSGNGDNGIEWMMNKQKKKIESKNKDKTKNKLKKFKEEDLPGMSGIAGIGEINESKSNIETHTNNDEEDCLFAERFNEAFQIFIEFKKYFHLILRHFLDILNPLLIFTNLPVIFKNIRTINQSELPQLISLFGSEVRQDLFHQIASESPPTTSQLHILRALQNLEGNKMNQNKKDKSSSQNNTGDVMISKVIFSDNNLNYYSNICQKEIAALALQLCQSESTSIRNEGALSFAWLARTNPKHAKLYLETAMLYLAYPPEDNPKIQTDIRAFGAIAQSILGACIMSSNSSKNNKNNKNDNKNEQRQLALNSSSSSLGNSISGLSSSFNAFNSMNYVSGPQKNWKRDELANSVAGNINKFLDRALVDVDIFDSSFFAAFSLMIVLPDYLIPSSLAAAAVSLFSEYLISHQKISELDNQRLKFIAQEICLFLTAHSGYECFSRFLRTIYDKPFLFTKTTMLGLLIEIPKNSYVINSSSFRKVFCDLLLNSMNPLFFKATPNVEHVKYRLKYPMVSPSEALNSTVFMKPKHPIIYSKLSDDVYAYKILQHYAKYVEVIIQTEASKATSSSFSTSFFNSVLSSLFQSSSSDPNTQLMCHSLIHSLCLNETTRKCFSSNFYKQMISTMTSVNNALFNASKVTSLNLKNEFTRIQVSAESIALFANHFGSSNNNSKFFDDILRFIKDLAAGPVKCFIYSSLFAHCKLSLNQLTSMMNELDKFASNSSIMPYALHALSVLFKTYSLDLLKMKVPDTQFQVILNLMNSPNTLQPFNLYFTSQCFTSLLSVISPEFAEDQRQQEIDEIQEIHDKLDQIYNKNKMKDDNKSVTFERNNKNPSTIRMLVPTLNLIIQAFYNIEIPYSKLIFFNTIRSVLAFASDSLTVPHLVFPTSRGISMSLWISACGAFTDHINANILKERKKQLHMQNIEQVKLQYKQKQLKNQSASEIDDDLSNISFSAYENDEIDNTDNNEDYFYLIPRNLLFLQRSCDERILEFVVTIAKKFLLDIENDQTKSDPNKKDNIFNSKRIRKRITQWCKIFSSVLANNVLPETGIESAPIVKRCCLESAVYILDILSKSEPLMTENLDDMITIITRAIETRKTILLKDAYLLLTDVIKKFQSRVTTVSNSNANSDGIRLLLLYDSQFSIAVRTGFICNLQYSGQFLIEYLHFHLEDLKTRPEDFENVLNSYIKGLMTCTQRTYAYYAVAAHLICLARENKIVFEMINRIDEVSQAEEESETAVNKEITENDKTANISSSNSSKSVEKQSFAMSIMTQLCEIFSISMALWRSTPPDWQQISQFRTNYSMFYREICVAFVWLQGVLGTEFIDLNSIIDFESEELKSCTESWRVLAAFDVVTTAFLVTPQKIKQEQIEKVTESVKKANEKFPQLLNSSTISKFFNICRMIGDSLINNKSGTGGITSEQLNALSETSKFDPEATAEMIQNSEIEIIAQQLNNRIVSEFISGQLNSKEFLSLSTLVFEKVGCENKDDDDLKQNHLKKFLSLFLSKISNVTDDQVVLNYLTRILRRLKGSQKVDEFECPISVTEFEVVAKFAWSRFKVGGMFLISELLIENACPISLSLFLFRNLDVIRQLILNDIVNASVFIQFVTMGITIFSECIQKVGAQEKNEIELKKIEAILTFLNLIQNLNDSSETENEKVRIQLFSNFFIETVKKAAFVCLEAISKWGPDLRGEEVIKNAAFLLRCIDQIETQKVVDCEISPLRQAFDEIGQRESRYIVQFIENEELKAERNKTAVNKLKIFANSIESSGTNENKRKLRNVRNFDDNNDDDEYNDDDWESL